MNKSMRYLLARPAFYLTRLSQFLFGTEMRGGFRILTLHAVSSRDLSALDRMICYLKKNYGILTPGEAEERLRAGSAANPAPVQHAPYLITFDDGFASSAAAAFKILDSHKVKAVFFICPGLMNFPLGEQEEAVGRYIFDGVGTPEGDPEAWRLMTWEEARILADGGHMIGSHTMLHRRLSGLNSNDKKDEIVISADEIERKLGTAIRWFAYPFGDIESIDAESLRLILSRYQYCCSGVRGLNLPGSNPVSLLREALDLQDTFTYQRLTMAGGLDFFYRKKIFRLEKMVLGIA